MLNNPQSGCLSTYFDESQKAVSAAPAIRPRCPLDLPTVVRPSHVATGAAPDGRQPVLMIKAPNMDCRNLIEVELSLSITA